MSSFHDLVDCSTYDTAGFCQGYQARRHRSQQIAIDGSQRCRRDFQSAMGDSSLSDVVTYENPIHGHIVAVLMPCTLPDRLELLSYLSEYFCIHDDQEDAGDQDSTLSAERKTARKALLKSMLSRFIAINPVQAAAVLKAFTEYSMIAAKLEATQSFATIDDYIQYRYSDFASDFILAATMFGMDMDPLTPEESLLVDPLIKLCFKSMALVNDYFSFDVEYVSSKTKDNIKNGVSVLMHLNNSTTTEAKAALKDIAISFDVEYLARWNELKAEGTLSPRMDRLLEALAFQMIGKVIWSQTTLRYDVAYRIKHRERSDSLMQSQNAAAVVDTSALATSATLNGALAAKTNDIHVAVVKVTPETLA